MYRPLLTVFALLAAAGARAGDPAIPPLPLSFEAEAKMVEKLAPDGLDSACRAATGTADPGLPCAQLALRHLARSRYMRPSADYFQGAALAFRACNFGNARGCALVAWLQGVGFGRRLDGESLENAQGQQVENLLTGARRRCAAKDAYSCAELGDRAAAGNGVELSFADAAGFYERACLSKRPDAGACARLGELSADGNGVVRNLDDARKYLRVACEAKIRTACERLAKLEPPAKGREENADAPRCKGGDAEACAQLGRALLETSGPRRDYGGAAAAFRKACDAGKAQACSSLALMYSRGAGVPRRDCAKAAQLDERACDLGSLVGCTALATRLSIASSGVEAEERRALALALGACDGGERTGCALAGTLLAGLGRREESDPEEAEAYQARSAELLERACRSDEPASCAPFAYALGMGQGVKRDRPRAIRLARAACEVDPAYGCFVLGQVLVLSRPEHEVSDSEHPGNDAADARRLRARAERAEAREVLDKACSHGSWMGCLMRPP